MSLPMRFALLYGCIYVSPVPTLFGIPCVETVVALQLSGLYDSMQLLVAEPHM